MQKLQLSEEVVQYFQKWYDTSELDQILEKIATPPLDTTIRLNYSKEQLTSQATTIPKVIVERVEEYSTNGQVWNAEILETVPDIVLIRPETTQNNTIEYNHPRVAVDQYAASAILRGADLMAVGVLGVDFGTSEESKGYKKNQPVSIVVDVLRTVKKGANLKGPDCQFPETAPFIANGIALMGRREIFCGQKVSGVAVKITEKNFPSIPLNDIVEASNTLFLQNLPSALAAHILDPQPGETILDMCSAPGGKTTHLAQLMGNKGKIFAMERGKSKLKNITTLCERLGITCVEPIAGDSTKCLSNRTFQPHSFDRILLDPPCSGIGLRPRFKEDTTVAQLQEHANYQKKFIKVAYDLLKSGGTLTYSTCTMHPLENEENVSWALSNFPGLELVDIDSKLKLGDSGLPNCGLNEEQRNYVQRFSPTSSLDCNAFFIAKFRKK